MPAYEEKITALSMAMIHYYENDPRRIQHFLKVHTLARLIGQGEGLEARTQATLEAAALVHDIGIRPAEERFGRSTPRLQEELGPPAAEAMLKGLGFPEGMVRRVCFLVGHHHTYHSIQGEDYRILVEADFLVNLYEDGAGREEAEAVLEQIFRTGTGTALCRAMFGLEKGREEKGGGGIWSC